MPLDQENSLSSPSAQSGPIKKKKNLNFSSPAAQPVSESLQKFISSLNMCDEFGYRVSLRWIDPENTRKHAAHVFMCAAP